MRDADFSYAIGLQKPGKPSKTLLKFVKDQFGMTNDDEVTTSKCSRHSAAGTTATEDIVILQQPGGLSAGQVWAHVAVNGAPWTLLQNLRLLEEDRSEGTAIWEPLDQYEFIETAKISDAIVSCDLGNSNIRSNVPRDAY